MIKVNEEMKFFHLCWVIIIIGQRERHGLSNQNQLVIFTPIKKIMLSQMLKSNIKCHALVIQTLM